MKKTLALVAFLALSTPALAATTWTEIGNRATAVCTTGTEAAPSGAVGLSLWAVTGFAVHVEAAGATTAGTLQAYLWNPGSGAWNRAPDLDLVVPAGVTTYAWAGFSVTAQTGRVAFVPVGIGQASSVYIIGAGR